MRRTCHTIFTNRIDVFVLVLYNDKAKEAQAMAIRIEDFHRPRFREIPNMGLYLDQTIN